MHGHRVGHLLQQLLRGARHAGFALEIFVFEVPVQQHHAGAHGVELADEGHVVGVAGDEHHHVEGFVQGQLQGFEAQPHVDAFFLQAAVAGFQGHVVRLHAQVHQNIVEQAVVKQAVFVAGFGGREAAPEKVGVGNLRQAHVYVFFFGYLVANVLVQAFEADAGFALVLEIIIVADF